ncbi:MAG TPA: DUF6318 family protein [Nocardioides sp.]|nr:DUF6318 family protein [Nocardioides sp.]
MKRLLALLATGAALALSGCGQAADPPAQADPTPSVSPTKAAPTAPVMPDAATQQTKAGAIAFARYYWRVVDYAQLSRDTDPLSALQTSRCRACDAGRKWIEQIDRRHGTISGGQHRITAVEAHSDSGTGFIVFLRQSTSPQRVSGAGDLNNRYSGGRQHLVMNLSWASGWRVASWDTTD